MCAIEVGRVEPSEQAIVSGGVTVSSGVSPGVSPGDSGALVIVERHLVRISASCSLTLRPPTTRQSRMSLKRASCLPIASHCAASSRVGSSTSTRVAAMRRGL